jgi:hypothetical protein
MILNLIKLRDFKKVSDNIFDTNKYEDLDALFYAMWDKNTFVFIDSGLHKKLKSDTSCSISGNMEEDMTVDDMLKKDVLVITIDSIDEVAEIVNLTKKYTEKEVEYLIVRE